MIDQIKQQIALAALCALMFLRFVDLAVFDADHDHIDMPHVQMHSVEMVHHHDQNEPSEHSTPEGKSAHVGFHTLLSVFIDAEEAGILPTEERTHHFGLTANDQVRTHGHRPPTPPPLA